MIDRIRIYVNDVEFDDVETRLALSPSGIDKDGSFKYASTIRNLKFTSIPLEISGGGQYT